MTAILVVEDEDAIRGIFSRFLAGKGYQVSEARNGQDAIAQATRQAFDVIIMDIRMPTLDGLSAYQQIHGMCGAKVMLITGYQLAADVQAQLEADGVRYLHKPVLLKDLETALNELLGSGQAKTATPDDASDATTPPDESEPTA